uniref:Macro domain-containing protein n=1 Tax=Xiphophorus maculatus TaxID=8083 RepID=A0A3B5QEV4_XIPMA
MRCQGSVPGCSPGRQSESLCLSKCSPQSFPEILRLKNLEYSLKQFEFMMHSGVKVSVWKADLTNFPADAVVNAANEDLKHYGGLALALSKAGGPQIQLESDDYIKKYSKVNTGEAVVLSSGSLPCKMIIHAVGPDLSMSAFNFDPEKGRPALEKTIKSILNRVGENHLATVAIPAISSGLFNYPLRECANTIVSTIRAFCDKLPHQNHYPKEIFLWEIGRLQKRSASFNFPPGNVKTFLLIKYTKFKVTSLI